MLRILVLCFLCLVLWPTASQAGAWCMPQGALYSKLSVNRYYTEHTFDRQGKRRSNPEGSKFYDYNLSWYGEYGLRDNLSLFGTATYKRLKSHYRYRDTDGRRQSINTTYNGPGDFDVGLKYGLLSEPLVVSVQALTKLAWLYGGSEKVPPGNNQNDYEIKLLVGKSLWPFPGYCGVEIGYRWRAGAPSDEYRYLLEFGFNPTEKLSLRFKLDGIKSTRNARLPSRPSPYVDSYVDYETGRLISTVYRPEARGYAANPSLGLQYDLGKLECTIGYMLSRRWTVEFTYTSYPYGKNIATGNQLSAAFIYCFSQ